MLPLLLFSGPIIPPIPPNSKRDPLAPLPSRASRAAFDGRGRNCNRRDRSPTPPPHPGTLETQRISQDELFEPLAGIRRCSLRLRGVAGKQHQNQKNATTS